MRDWKKLCLMTLVPFLAAIIGASAGRYLLPATPPAGAELHAVLHDKLDLDPAQHAALDGLEQAFAQRRRTIEGKMRADNVRLAEAIRLEQGYGAKVSAAIDHSHQLMGQLQKETLAHIFAMRALLRPEQAEKFDAAVASALTKEQP
jgi:nickel and cobalt resistance protein CnrR